MERIMREDKPNYRGRLRSADWCVCEDPSLTVQSDHDRADIKKIIKRYHQTGIIDNLNEAEAQFLDCTKFSDYAEIQRELTRAKQQFMEQPPHVRRAFNNDVAEWLDAAHDQEKREALVEAGTIDDLEGSEEEPSGETEAGEE